MMLRKGDKGMGYLLSVIIPTKNRYQYLKDCLSTISRLNASEIEVVVQDNTEDNSEIVDFLDKLDNSSIKYYHSTKSVSQTENSDNATSKATGEYCVYIGDDDTITLQLLDVVKYMKKNGILACVCDMAHYYWPDVVFEKNPKPPLSFDTIETKIVNLNANEVLIKTLRGGALDIKYLARVYHGIVHHKVLDDVYNSTNSFFPGPSPDMANAISCTSVLNNYVYINAPLIISGVGFGSAAGMGHRGAHKGSLKEAKQLPEDAIRNWSNKIPQIWIGYTVWPESAEKALIRMDKKDYIQYLNYTAPLARTYLKFKEYRPLVRNYLRKVSSKTSFVIEIFKCLMLLTKRKKVQTEKKIKHEQYIVNKQISLEEAFDIVNKYYLDSNTREIYQ